MPIRCGNGRPVGADVAAAKAIDRLFGIPDQGQGGVAIKQGFKQAPLDRVGVLKFVDQAAAQLLLSPLLEPCQHWRTQAGWIHPFKQITKAQLLLELAPLPGPLPQGLHQFGEQLLNGFKTQLLSGSMQTTAGGLVGVGQHPLELTGAEGLHQFSVGLDVVAGLRAFDQLGQLGQLGFAQQRAGWTLVASAFAELLHGFTGADAITGEQPLEALLPLLPALHR